MTLKELELEINRFYLDSEKDLNGDRKLGVYPNSVLLTREHYNNFLKELFKTEEEFPPEIIIQSICGMKVILTSFIDKPKLIRI